MAQSQASPRDDVAPHTWTIQLIPVFQSEAQELTIVKMSKFGGGIGAPSKEERLKEAADIHLRLGQIQRYCELMVELGQVRRRGRAVPPLDSSMVSVTVSVFVFQWEKALSVAPGVSMKYWKKLMQRYPRRSAVSRQLLSSGLVWDGR